MKVLILTLGPPALASSRVRGWNFGAEMRRHGVEAYVFQGPTMEGVREIFRRRWDLVLVQKWAAPIDLLRAVRLQTKVLMLDIDDAVLMDTKYHPAGDAKLLARNTRRLRKALQLNLYDCISVSTPRLREDVQSYCDVPTITFCGPRPRLEEDIYRAESRRDLVWLGSPATQQYLLQILPDIDHALLRRPLVAVGVSGLAANANWVHEKSWSIENQKQALAHSSIGLFPQPKGQWEDRKSGYKIFEYICAGVIPVAVNGPQAWTILGEEYPYLVSDQESWTETIARALNAPNHLEIIKGLVDKTEAYSYSAVIGRWLGFSSEVMTAV
ncbi:hypothetical protein [Gordonia polyisoprenivorans]|uniref:hypothetical protein n=1 Tax=Gordonia polyisoprenivorans TaxID=84595 RepID=UPI0012DF6B0D|nr:hypothetical protein [Gordonia polyisoprenivorans]